MCPFTSPPSPREVVSFLSLYPQRVVLRSSPGVWLRNCRACVRGRMGHVSHGLLRRRGNGFQSLYIMLSWLPPTRAFVLNLFCFLFHHLHLPGILILDVPITHLICIVFPYV